MRARSPRQSGRVFVDVTAFNSKVYYVEGDVAAPGRLPITGNETVLDALNYAGGFAPTAAPQNVRLVRPAPPPAREVYLLQRRSGKLGERLGKTTGWIHRTTLKNKEVRMMGGVNYERIDDQGLLISHGERREEPTWLEVDHVVLCAGQEPLRELVEPLRTAGVKVHLIGGAHEAAELDAKRAIDQGVRLGAAL